MDDLRILGAVGAALAVLAVVLIPRRLAARKLFGDNHAARLGVENEIRRTIIQMLGGSFVLASVFFTYETVRISQESLTLTERGQVTERFTRAIDQIGSGEVDVAIGGIYALGQLARESRAEHEQVIDILVAFIHRHSGQDVRQQCPGKRSSPRADVQAAVTVIGQRETEYEAPDTVVDLRNVNLAGGDFSGGDYDRLDFRGSCLVRANFRGASVESADFSVHVLGGVAARGFDETDLTGADFHLANGDGAKFVGTVMPHVTMVDASLVGADMSSAAIGESGTYAVGGAADLTGVDLRDADLRGATLGFVSLRNANLEGAKVSEKRLERADTEGATLP